MKVDTFDHCSSILFRLEEQKKKELVSSNDESMIPHTLSILYTLLIILFELLNTLIEHRIVECVPQCELVICYAEHSFSTPKQELGHFLRIFILSAVVN